MKEITNCSDAHNTFGGFIYPSDFCTDFASSGRVIDRIASSFKFDERCKKTIESKKRMKKGNIANG